MSTTTGVVWPETYRQVLEHLPQTAVAVFDQELRFRMVTGPALVDAGLERGKVEGRRLEEVVPDPAASRLAAAYRRALAGETISLRYRSTLNGRSFWLRILPLARNTTASPLAMAVTLDITELVEAELRVQKTVRALEAVQEISGVGSWSWDLGGSEFELSRETDRILGHAASEGPVSAELLLGCIVDTPTRKRVAATFGAVGAGTYTKEEFRLECRIRRLDDGALRWVSLSGRGAESPTGVVVGTLQDVTDLREAELAATRQRDFVEAVIAAADDGILLSREARIVDVNPSMCRLVGFDREELLGLSPPYPFWSGHHADAAHRHLDAVADSGRTARIEAALRHRDGTEIAVAISTVLVARRPDDPDGSVTQVSTVRDITAQKRYEAELRRLATRDALTGLLNQRAFREITDRELARSRRHQQPLSLAILDLDHFKAVNDRHGHPVGDSVLEELARRLERLARREESMARLGGEEFGWILPDTAESVAFEIAERARQAIAAEPFDPVGQLTISIGVSELDADADARELYARADRALYSAKQQGRNRTARYSHTPE